MNFTSLFGAEKISFDYADKLQQSAPDIIVWAAPVMFFFVFIEYMISKKQHHNFYNNNETIGSILVGIGNVIMGAAIKLLLFYLLIWIYELVDFSSMLYHF
jgi:hypothetical protein